ncbi:MULTISPECIES: acyl-CoA thioesterase [Kitasatospora]|uniref:Acyl-CoA thioester hydrolase n=2 Tax=Kitasatospora TaxID=2063 RepID=A0ABT1J8F1_9ACTN|nr:acyl-CoA thioesterase [Kitasatospora paracochleata]MCP2313717.1 acyl-CoA thioester hydrolase [Kitasatospora paracochleata]
MNDTGTAGIVHRSRVEWMDTDAAGHHHNTAVVRYLEAAEAALMHACGITGYFGAAPRVHYAADFTSPLRFGQEVTTHLTVERVGTSSLTLRFEMWGEATDHHPRRLAATGRYTTAHVPAGHTGSTPWPTAWTTAWNSPLPPGPPHP